MPKYIVTCVEKYYYETEVEADSDEEAIEFMKDNPPSMESYVDSVFENFEIRSCLYG